MNLFSSTLAVFFYFPTLIPFAFDYLITSSFISFRKFCNLFLLFAFTYTCVLVLCAEVFLNIYDMFSLSVYVSYGSWFMILYAFVCVFFFFVGCNSATTGWLYTHWCTNLHCVKHFSVGRQSIQIGLYIVYEYVVRFNWTLLFIQCKISFRFSHCKITYMPKQ